MVIFPYADTSSDSDAKPPQTWACYLTGRSASQNSLFHKHTAQELLYPLKEAPSQKHDSSFFQNILQDVKII